jgi:cellulose synthase/poly-beta-1,6-N-acetylglucosamine synthase-like glycosyltransferase
MSLSCLNAERRWQVLGVVAAMIVIVGAAWYLSGVPVLSAALLTITGFNLVVAGTEARWRLYGWRTPDAKEKIAWPAPVQPGAEQLTFSLIVPVRDEAAVIGDTLRGLMRQSHPGVHVIVSLCDDDPDTIAEVRAVIRERPQDGRLGMVIGQYAKPSKALQLNRALSLCAGDIVGVIDAEDDVAGGLLSHAEALFLESGADVVQGGVQLMNIGTSPAKWFQVHNVLEYFFWFTSRMAFHAQEGFVPLGGNTVFIRRDLLEAAGGWPHSLTEDCALGVKLCTQFGAKVATAYSAELTTKEEAPPSIFNKEAGSLFWQRDRWVRGFIGEFISGRWLEMDTLRQKALAGYILATPILQAISFVLLPTAIAVGLLVKTPLAVAALMFLPVIPITVTVLTQLIGLHDFCQQYGQRASGWHYASVLFLAPLYQVLLAAAAAVAVWKFAIGDDTWYKTGRVAEHRSASVTERRSVGVAA